MVFGLLGGKKLRKRLNFHIFLYFFSDDIETDEAPYGPEYALDDPFLRSLTDQQFPLFEEISHLHRNTTNIDYVNENSNSSSSDAFSLSPLHNHGDSDLSDINNIINEYSNCSSPGSKVLSTLAKCRLSPDTVETVDRKRTVQDGQPSPPKQPHLDFPVADEDGDRYCFIYCYWLFCNK